MGAWIEIYSLHDITVSSGCRPRMGAWIEIAPWLFPLRTSAVAPVWGRGLKLTTCAGARKRIRSPPYGGVD